MCMHALWSALWNSSRLRSTAPQHAQGRYCILQGGFGNCSTYMLYIRRKWVACTRVRSAGTKQIRWISGNIWSIVMRTRGDSGWDAGDKWVAVVAAASIRYSLFLHCFFCLFSAQIQYFHLCVGFWDAIGVVCIFSIWYDWHYYYSFL